MSDTSLFSTLLMFHIVGGAVALLTGYGALAVQRGSPRHRTFGRLYVGGMTAVVLTGFPMSVLHPNPFLFGVVIFSGYFVLVGWLAARFRKGEALWLERSAAAVLFLGSAGALLYLTAIASTGVLVTPTFRTTGLVFALIGTAIAIRDGLQLRAGPLTGRDRTIKHLISMCAGLIATTTAFLVTAVGTIPHVPPLLLWLGPTVVLTPVISYWARRVRRGEVSAAGNR